MTPPTTFQTQYNTLLTQIIAGGHTPLIIMLSTWLVDSVHSNGGVIDPMISALSDTWGAQYVDITGICANSSTYGPAGLTIYFGGLPTTTDNYHPNTLGHHMIAGMVYGAILHSGFFPGVMDEINTTCETNQTISVSVGWDC